MEVTCTRCHQAIPEESCYCPTCGLPQLVYSTDEAVASPAQAERWNQAAQDASAVEWRPALRVALLIAIPAGLLSCGLSAIGLLGLFWMAAAAAWAVTLYMRRQRMPWITMGAGARIGLVTGILAGWLAFAFTGISLFTLRFFLGKGSDFDDPWRALVGQISQQWQSMSTDAQTSAALQGIAKWLLSPEGRASSTLGGLILFEGALLVFAAAGGAIGARLLARSRRPQA